MGVMNRSITWSLNVAYLIILLIPCGGNPCDNHKALGMQDRTISESQLTASSNQDLVKYARLNRTRAAWVATEDDQSLWFQVTFLNVVYVTAIATQGNPTEDMYVKEYKLYYGFDENDLRVVTNGHGDEQLFMANKDNTSPVHTGLPDPMRLTIIRISATRCEGTCALRIELYGGEAPLTTSAALDTSSTTPAPLTASPSAFSADYVTSTFISASTDSGSSIYGSTKTTVMISNTTLQTPKGGSSRTITAALGGFVAGVLVVVALCFIRWKYCERTPDVQGYPSVNTETYALSDITFANSEPSRSKNVYVRPPSVVQDQHQQTEVDGSIYIDLDGPTENLVNVELIDSEVVSYDNTASTEIQDHEQKHSAKSIEPSDQLYPALPTPAESDTAATAGKADDGTEKIATKVENDPKINEQKADDKGDDKDADFLVVYNDAESAFKGASPITSRPPSLNIYSTSDIGGRRPSGNIQSSQWGTWTLKNIDTEEDQLSENEDAKSMDKYVDTYDTYPFNRSKTKDTGGVDDGDRLRGENQEDKTREDRGVSDDSVLPELESSGGKFDTFPLKSRQKDTTPVGGANSSNAGSKKLAKNGSPESPDKEIVSLDTEDQDKSVADRPTKNQGSENKDGGKLQVPSLRAISKYYPSSSIDDTDWEEKTYY